MTYNHIDIEQLFKAEMASVGIHYAGEIIADGKLHRFHIEGDKPRTQNGWLVLHPDGVPSGVFGNWKTSTSATWCAKSRKQMTKREWILHQKKINHARQQRNQAKKQDHQQAAVRAKQIWDTAKPANSHHPYLIKKHISPFIARQRGDSIVLPLVDCDKHIQSLQFIYHNGSKKLLYGGAKKGNFILINNFLDSSQILICEGFATGATLAQNHPTACVIAAIDAGNLESVAVSIRNRRPNTEIIICADDDRQRHDNPGANKGRRAAIAAGALLSIPHWPDDAPESLTDFNDLACWLNNSNEVAL